MKKFLVLGLLLVVLASGAYSLDRNFGFGLGGNYSNSNGKAGGYSWNMDRSGVYLFGFFGISQFIELNLGIIEKYVDELSIGGQKTGFGGELSTALQLGIYGKWPFPLGTNFVFFPTAGVDFEFSLDEDWWNEFWFRGGVGMDFFPGQKFFIRAHLLFGYGLPFGGDEDLGVKDSIGAQIKLGVGWMF